jgi:hypothetical protein
MPDANESTMESRKLYATVLIRTISLSSSRSRAVRRAGEIATGTGRSIDTRRRRRVEGVAGGDATAGNQMARERMAIGKTRRWPVRFRPEQSLALPIDSAVRLFRWLETGAAGSPSVVENRRLRNSIENRLML